MKAKRFSFVLVALVLSGSFLSAAHADLTGTLEAYRVLTKADGEESFLPADKAQPKDVIEYRLTYQNTGEESVQNVFITDPVPAGAECIVESATQPKGGRVEYSIDGGETFKAWPILVVHKTTTGKEKLVAATPDMVTHVRWLFGELLAPEDKFMVSYRTVLK